MTTNQPKKKTKRDNKFWIRVICIVLVVLLAGSYLVSALLAA